MLSAVEELSKRKRGDRLGRAVFRLRRKSQRMKIHRLGPWTKISIKIPNPKCRLFLIIDRRRHMAAVVADDKPKCMEYELI
jgi:hypothetical protein